MNWTPFKPVKPGFYVAWQDTARRPILLELKGDGHFYDGPTYVPSVIGYAFTAQVENPHDQDSWMGDDELLAAGPTVPVAAEHAAATDSARNS